MAAQECVDVDLPVQVAFVFDQTDRKGATLQRASCLHHGRDVMDIPIDQLAAQDCVEAAVVSGEMQQFLSFHKPLVQSDSIARHAHTKVDVSGFIDF